MTKTAFFPKVVLDRLIKKLAMAKDKRALIKDEQDIVDFVAWYLKRRYINDGHEQKDKDINFVWLGYEAHAHFQWLIKKHPYVETITGDELAHFSARNRVYPWMDDEGNWNYWGRVEMEEHYEAFIENEKAQNVYGDYSLEKIDPMGKSEAYPACAYLSYAYHEEIRWKTIIQALINFLCCTN